MSSSCIDYCFGVFTDHCQSLENDDLKAFLCDTLGYKRFKTRELFQEYQWLLDEGALSEWLVEFLNDRMTDQDAVNALVETAFTCSAEYDSKILINRCLKWLKEYPPVQEIRSVNLVEPIQDRKTIVLTETTAATSTLLSLKTELADAKKQLMLRDYEYADLKTKYDNLKKEIFRLSAEWKGMSKAFEIRFPE
jgi:hypothetical protein